MKKLLTALFVSAFALAALPSFAASQAGAMPAAEAASGAKAKAKKKVKAKKEQGASAPASK